MLREVWLNIGIEKVDTHESITVKALLDSGAMCHDLAKWLSHYLYFFSFSFSFLFF